MARSTIRRPFSVNSQSKDGFFTQAQFKGICDNKNDVTIDQQTFADADNIFVDNSGVLVSRPPLKFHDTDTLIIEQWFFGNIQMRLYKTEAKKFKLVSGNKKIEWTLITDTNNPPIKLVPIEDKIFYMV